MRGGKRYNMIKDGAVTKNMLPPGCAHLRAAAPNIGAQLFFSFTGKSSFLSRASLLFYKLQNIYVVRRKNFWKKNLV